LLAQQSDPSISDRQNRAKPKDPRHIHSAEYKSYAKGFIAGVQCHAIKSKNHNDSIN